MYVVRAERLSPLQDEVGDLVRVLARFRWRLGIERLLVFSLAGVMGCAAMFIGLSLAAWLTASTAAFVLGSYGWLVALPLVAALGLALLRWPSERQAALAADRRLLLDERLATAVELARRLRRGEPGDRFDRLQVRDAVEQAAAAPGGWLALDRHIRRDALLALGLTTLAAASLLLTNLPPPSIGVQDQSGSLADAGPADMQQRALPLDAANPAIADAQPVQQQTPPSPDLAARVQQGQSERVALDALSQALGQVSAAQPAADAIQQGDYSTAKQQLANLGDQADQLSGAAKRQLASALQQAANTNTSADRQLADRERQAASALVRSSYADQSQALHSLADQVERSGARSVPADQLARDVGQLQQQSGGQGSAAQGAAAQGSAGAAQGAADQAPGAGQQGGDQGAQGQGGQQNGPGVGNGPGGDPLGDTSSRLESAGQSVTVPLTLGTGAGVRPPDGTEDQTGNDPSAGPRGVSEQVQAQQTGQVAPEQNLVPSEQRPVVRGYFQ